MPLSAWYDSESGLTMALRVVLGGGGSVGLMGLSYVFRGGSTCTGSSGTGGEMAGTGFS